MFFIITANRLKDKGAGKAEKLIHRHHSTLIVVSIPSAHMGWSQFQQAALLDSDKMQNKTNQDIFLFSIKLIMNYNGVQRGSLA